MKIVVVASSYPETHQDYKGIFVREMVEELRAKGNDVFVVVPDSTSELSLQNGFAVRYALKNFQTLFYGNGVYSNIKENPFRLLLLFPFTFSLFLKLTKILKDVDVVISHWLIPSGFITSLAFLLHTLYDKNKRVRHVVIVHGGDLRMLLNFKNTYLSKIIINLIKKSGAKLVFVSRALFETFKKHFFVPSEFVITPMGVKKEYFNADCVRFLNRKKSEVLKLLFVGRIVKEKGVDIAIEAIKRIKNRGVTLTVLGEGNYRKKLIKKYAHSSFVTFKGACAPDRLDTYFKSHDALLFTSYDKKGIGEGMPTVILRAMAGSLPVIASDAGGTSEIISNGKTGFVFRAGNVSELANLLERLKNNPEELKKVSGRAFEVVKKFEWSKVLNKILGEL